LASLLRFVNKVPKISRTRIKFCGLVRSEDVVFAARLGVDAIGLVFYPKSPRFLSLEDARALRQLLPSYVACVGLFVNADPSSVREHRSKLGLDVIQFHGDETMSQISQSLVPETLRTIQPGSNQTGAASTSPFSTSPFSTSPFSTSPFWRALRVKPDSDLLELSAPYAAAEALLLDAYSEAYGGTGKGFDWSQAKSLPSERIILSGGLDAGSVSRGISALSPLAVDVSSGIQAEHARAKSPERMEQFMAAVQKADFLKVSR
jgi:phosphoribosylanthranilate isomerase